MNTSKIVETVKDAVSGAKGKVDLIKAHGQDVIQTSAHTLQAAKDVVVEGGQETAKVLTHTREELQRTLKEGAEKLGHKLSHLATPTRKEQAEAHKAEIKEKKQRRRATQH